MLIWFINKIYLLLILVFCVQSYFLPFSYRSRLRCSLAFVIKITASIDRPQIKRKETDKDRGSKSTNNRTYTDLSLTIVFSKRSGLLH